MICADDVAPGNGVILKGCLHQFCKQCMHDHVMLSDDADIKCPYQDANYACGAVISEREIREVVDDDELQKVYQRGLQLAENADADSFHCRHTDCKGFCFVADEVNEFVCPICKKPNCLLCKAIHEDMDCQEYQDDLKRRAENDAAAQATQNMLEDLVRNGEAMKCPKCDIVVQKKDGCDWIRCSMCRTEICWATKGPRWGPNGHGDTSGGCKCRVGGKKCHALCRNCH